MLQLFQTSFLNSDSEADKHLTVVGSSAAEATFVSLICRKRCYLIYQKALV